MERILHCFLLIHLFFTVIPECATNSEVIHSETFPIYTYMNWSSAQKYCRTYYRDLVSIRNEEELKDLGTARGWIGLYRQAPDGVWKWSGRDENVSSIIWDEDESQSDEDCVFKTMQAKLKSYKCSNLKSILCAEDTLILVKEMKTWEEAYEHCTDLRAKGSIQMYSLASFSTFSDYDWSRRVKESATTNEVWVGLRFLADEWFWMNGQPVESSNLPVCPAPQQHCGALDNKDNKWKIMDCGEKRNFLCQMEL